MVWSLKTIRSGNTVRLRGFPNLSINKGEERIPAFLKKNQETERISMFMTFGLDGFHLDRFIKEYELKRKDTIEHLKCSKFKSTVLELANAKNLRVLKLLPEQEI